MGALELVELNFQCGGVGGDRRPLICVRVRVRVRVPGPPARIEPPGDGGVGHRGVPRRADGNVSGPALQAHTVRTGPAVLEAGPVLGQSGHQPRKRGQEGLLLSLRGRLQKAAEQELLVAAEAVCGLEPRGRVSPPGAPVKSGEADCGGHEGLPGPLVGVVRRRRQRAAGDAGDGRDPCPQRPQPPVCRMGLDIGAVRAPL